MSARIRRFCRLFDEGNEKAFCIAVSGVPADIGNRLWQSAMRQYRD